MVFLKKIGVAEIAESNGDVRVLTGSSQMTVSEHALYKFGQYAAKCSLKCPF